MRHVNELKAIFVKCFLLTCLITLYFNKISAQRKDILLNDDWYIACDSLNVNAFPHFEQINSNTNNWLNVSVPHNWDDYGGYIRLLHGNRHGYAFYRKYFTIKTDADKKVFLWFEGVSSYATVWVNGKKVAYHAGGRTSFTVDISDVVYKDGTKNILSVRADHPAEISDLPWVCGGCSDESGFSEGSQPMGIFRPVHLIETGGVRVQPFGVHIWNDSALSEKKASLYLETELKNFDNKEEDVVLINQLIDRNGELIAKAKKQIRLNAGETNILRQSFHDLSNIKLWSLEHPYLYHVITEIKYVNGKISDNMSTAYGIRTISWPVGKKNPTNQFLLNGKPVFINGIAEYEHALGQSHAFSKEEIASRALMIKNVGFNAFRDAHQPHNLLYQTYWDSLGLLWWPQFSAHIWSDTPAFRNNFIQLLKDWIKERRNSPSVILWGLQNESHLPEDFAKQCCDTIRALDPTASSQRLITTCNGGKGTDWDVPQNWTGTYGGDPATYAEDLKKQILVGEYGGWRTIDLHAEDSDKLANNENKWCDLIEQKIRFAQSVKDSVCGHFFWLFNSHDNPGRVQSGEGYRELDAIGPVNYKGLLTSWEEPTDGYYLFKANYASKITSPVVYIVSHTWPDRWLQSGIKNNIQVYSNCDSVQLFNDIDSIYLGTKKNSGTGRHFTWNNVFIKYNLLYAIGYVNGKPVTKDVITLHHLPNAPHIFSLKTNKKIIKPEDGYNYIYRINCGGGVYKDSYNNIWEADRQLIDSNSQGSVSWTKDYPGIPYFFASQREIFDPIKGTNDWRLFQTFRYGRDKLKFIFPLPDGNYRVELYFTEPWWGTGENYNYSGTRLFNVSINDSVVIKNLDIFKESGGAHIALKKVINVNVKGGKMIVSFPNTLSGEAVISAIAVASIRTSIKAAPVSKPVINILTDNANNANLPVTDWLDTGDSIYIGNKTTIASLPPELYGVQWIYSSYNKDSYKINFNQKSWLYVGIDTSEKVNRNLVNGFDNTGNFIKSDKPETFAIYKKIFKQNDTFFVPNNDKIFIAAKPVFNLTPSYDLKKEFVYLAVESSDFSGLITDTLYGNKIMAYKNERKHYLNLTFHTGVADYHTITLRYANLSLESYEAIIVITDENTTQLQQEKIILKPTKNGKWGSVTLYTPTMINAGKYTLHLQLSDTAKKIYIHSIQIR
ncbi:MAG: malectin domain-containing carbohydrate-binding protein [Arachidicoccus sp.]|nr:malectin domain-containing carbohydrate-binding protein [Arachidicoccus sp.]